MSNYNDVWKMAAAVEGIPILGCIPGSPAARAGLKVGDVLLVANGIRTRSIDDYFDALDVDAQKLEVTYYRDGEHVHAVVARVPHWHLLETHTESMH